MEIGEGQDVYEPYAVWPVIYLFIYLFPNLVRFRKKRRKRPLQEQRQVCNGTLGDLEDITLQGKTGHRNILSKASSSPTFVNTVISQIAEIKLTETPQEKLSKTAIWKNPMQNRSQIKICFTGGSQLLLVEVTCCRYFYTLTCLSYLITLTKDHLYLHYCLFGCSLF